LPTVCIGCNLCRPSETYVHVGFGKGVGCPRRRFGLAALALALICALAGCSGSPSSSNKETNQLELISWWTSASEQPALDVLVNAYTAAHPGVKVVNASVAGGGGSNAQVVLAQRLLSGNPPDVWQTFPGGALQAFVGQRQVGDVSSVIKQTGMATTLPKVILDGLTVDGKQYGVPTSSHRGNVLFYNSKLLDQASVAKPDSGYTVDALIADLGTLKKAGITPLCLGAKDPFTTVALFENVLLSVVGADGWAQIMRDRFDWNGAQTRKALGQFGEILNYADPEAAALTWDAAAKKLAAGQCAFLTMNDSAFGELVKAGAVDGTDFSELPFPGTSNEYVAVVDTFVQARSATDARNASDFLATIAAPDTQLEFSRIKGSVPVRTDVDVATLTPYQQSAARALRSSTVLWSIVHGSATSPRFQQAFYDAVQAYVRSGDPSAFSKSLTASMSRQPPAK
jgi:glucose/mannose transport system substrate-binding protein